MSKSNRNIILVFMVLCIIINVAVISNFSMYSPSKSEIIREVDTVKGIGEVLSKRVANKTVEIIDDTNKVNRTNIMVMKIELYFCLVLIIGCMVLLLMMWTDKRFNENEQRSYENHKGTQMLVMKGKDDDRQQNDKK